MKKPNLNFKRPKLDLKLPSLGVRGPSMPKTNVKAPKFVSDLYADLRDRRLLPLVALLVVAILAAPILLSGSGEDEAAPAPAPATGQDDGAQAASFSVVPSEPGLRDYRERLSHRQARNPFAQPTPQSSAADEGGEVEAGTGGTGGGGEAVVEGGSGGSSFDAGPTTSITTTTTDIVVESTVTGYVLEAKAGFLGDLKELAGIKPMTTLPSAKNPVLVFVGLSKDKRGAIFLMTSNVTAFYGKAKCVLDEQICSTVELKQGQSATFAYGYGETRYKFTLKKIDAVVETREDAASVTESSGGKED